MIPCLRFEIHFCLTERVTDFGRREWEKCKPRVGSSQGAKISFTLTALTSLGTTLGTSTCFSVFKLKRCSITFQELTLEELVPNPNTPPYHDGAVLSRNATSRNSSLRSEPITFPNESDSRLKTKQDSRRVVYSLRNGSPSPWVDRYKLKQKSISALTYVELKNKTSPAEEPPVRGFSR